LTRVFPQILITRLRQKKKKNHEKGHSLTKKNPNPSTKPLEEDLLSKRGGRTTRFSKNYSQGKKEEGGPSSKKKNIFYKKRGNAPTQPQKGWGGKKKKKEKKKKGKK